MNLIISWSLSVTNFRKLSERLANSLRDANELLAYLSEKNFIDDKETIMNTWELLAESTDALAEPEYDDIENALTDIKLAKEVESLPDFDLIISVLENVSTLKEELNSYKRELSKVMSSEVKDDFKTLMKIEYIPRLENFCDFLFDCDSTMRKAANTFRVLINEIEEKLN